MAKLSKEDVFSQLELEVTSLCQAINGHFQSRETEPLRDRPYMQLSYQISLGDYENFVDLLHKYALIQMDKDFTEILEKTLTT